MSIRETMSRELTRPMPLVAGDPTELALNEIAEDDELHPRATAAGADPGNVAAVDRLADDLAVVGNTIWRAAHLDWQAIGAIKDFTDSSMGIDAHDILKLAMDVSWPERAVATAATNLTLYAASFGLRELHEETDNELAVLHSAKKAGFLAALEGRHHDPDVAVRAERDPHFRAGLQFYALVAHDEARAPRLEALERVVRATYDAGRSAVVNGQDHGPAFRERYQRDIAFRDGVEHTRALRTDPAEYEREATTLRLHARFSIPLTP